MIRHYILGGVYTDTSFEEIVPGTEEAYGPFVTYDAAVEFWRGRMMRNVDICEHRLFIHAYYLVNDIGVPA